MYNFNEYLYKSLPLIYQKEDANIKPTPYPLQRFINILSEGGFDEIIKYIDSFKNLSNIDLIDPKFLPLLAHDLGMDFKYKLDDPTKRKFLKIMPVLYALKGTDSSFNYIAREVFGESAKVAIQSVPNSKDLNLGVSFDGDTGFDIDRRKLLYEEMLEIVRPVNTKLGYTYFIYYLEKYLREEITDNVVDKFLTKVLVEDIDVTNIRDVFGIETFKTIESDIYNAVNRVDDGGRPFKVLRSILGGNDLIGSRSKGLALDKILTKTTTEEFKREIKDNYDSWTYIFIEKFEKNMTEESMKSTIKYVYPPSKTMDTTNSLLTSSFKLTNEVAYTSTLSY